ncbi:MAG: hypothetical protein ABI723_21195 [Bacteroidia bacterium]
MTERFCYTMVRDASFLSMTGTIMKDASYLGMTNTYIKTQNNEQHPHNDI